LASKEAFIDSFWSAVTPHTRVIFFSHITSPTVLIFPVDEIIKRARTAGIITVIDGAHAPGQIPLDLDSLGADFYGGNLHKMEIRLKIFSTNRQISSRISNLSNQCFGMPSLP
jgi:isopenicillin-N epimerase